MEHSRIKPNKWSINVKFQSNGALLATATGILLVPPQDAVAFVTDAAGDKLFRVVERRELPPTSPQGGRRVEVVNRAAIRVLAWKLWSTSNVIYEVHEQPVSSSSCSSTSSGVSEAAGPGQEQQQQEGGGHERVTFELVSSSMLQSLKGTWSLRPIRVHTSALPAHILSSTPAAASPAAAAAATVPAALTAIGPEAGSLSTVSTSSSSCGSDSTNNRFRGSSGGGAMHSASSLFQKLAMLSPRARQPPTTTLPTAATPTAANAVANSTGSLPSAARASSSFLTHAGGLINGAGGLLGSSNKGLGRGLWDGRIGSSSSSSSSSSASASASASGGIKSSRLGNSAAPPVTAVAGTTETPHACLPPGLVVDAEGFVTATSVHYEQLAQPKGMPAGIRYVPGLSDAVAASIGKEVRQMLDKVACVSDVAVTQGFGPQQSLDFVVNTMEEAGGSFKALQKHLRKHSMLTHKNKSMNNNSNNSPCGAPAAALPVVLPGSATAVFGKATGEGAAAGGDGTAASVVMRLPVDLAGVLAEQSRAMAAMKLSSHPVNFSEAGRLTTCDD